MKTMQWWILQGLSLSLLVGGFVLIVLNGGWLVGLGVFLLLWANNLKEGR